MGIGIESVRCIPRQCHDDAHTPMSPHESPIQRDALVRHSPDVIVVLDEDRTITYHSPSADRVLGYDEGELVGEPALEYVHPEDRTRVVDALHSIDDAAATALHVRVRHADGLWVPVEATLSDPDEVAGVVVNARESTDRDAFGALHELYEIASATDLSFDDKCARVLDLGRQRLGLPYAFLTRITEDTQTIVAAEGDHELLQPGESCPIEESYCRKTIRTDGLLALFDASEEGFTADPAYQRFGLGCYIGSKIVVDDELYGTICFAGSDPRDREFSDSERTFVELASKWLSYELEQRQYQAELERQNDRLEQFASVVSHDLRNPLSVVAGHLDLERQQRDSENLQTAVDALDRAFELIDEVLEIARLGQGVTETEPLSLSAVASDAWEMVDHDDVDLVVEDAPTRVAADRDRLQRLLENLFRNSVEHGGSTLTTVRVGAIRDGFYVEDDGAGIPEDERDHVFEGGYTTATEGTGFGLSIVEQIAAAHGWSVSVTNSADGGARFEFEGTDPAPT